MTDRISLEALSIVSETMLATLYVGVQESRRPDALVRDPWAEELVSRIDCDFARLKISADSQVVRRCTESCVKSPKCWAYKVFYTEIATPPRDRGECRRGKCQARN